MRTLQKVLCRRRAQSPPKCVHMYVVRAADGAVRAREALQHMLLRLVFFATVKMRLQLLFILCYWYVSRQVPRWAVYVAFTLS